MNMLNNFPALSMQCEPPSQKPQDMSHQYEAQADHGQQRRLPRPTLKPFLTTDNVWGAGANPGWAMGPAEDPTRIAGPSTVRNSTSTRNPPNLILMVLRTHNDETPLINVT
jgi:hypothetical protein